MALGKMATAQDKYVAESMELPLPLEQRCHEQLLEHARAAQRRRLRPHAPHDVRRGDRTRKRIARALTVLRDEYEVPDELIREALRYSNTWEDALAFLALQRTSDALPASLRAAPQATDDKVDDTNGGNGGALDVVSAKPRAVEREERADERAEPMDDWENGADDDQAPAQAQKTETEKPETEKPETDATRADNEASDAAMSWTQRYLLQLAQEEELERQREKEEAALTPEARALRDLEAQFAALEDSMRQTQADGKLTKKKKKALSQDVQALRLQLVRMGWDEAKYRQAQREKLGVDDSDSMSAHKEKQKQKQTSKREDDAPQAEDSDDDQSYGSALFGPSPSSPASSPSPATESTAPSTSPSTCVLATFSLSSCASWTGKTPRDLLADHCKRHKWQRPQFKKLSSSRVVHRYSVVVDGGKSGTRREFTAGEELFPVRDGFRSIDEAKDVVATVALYALTPQLPLYGMLPPPYRALWLSWDDAQRKAAEASASAVQNEFDAFVDAILKDVPEELKGGNDVMDNCVKSEAAPVEKEEEKKRKEKEEEERGALSDWDVDDWDADLSDGDDAAEKEMEEEEKAVDEEGEGEEEDEDDDATRARSEELRRIFERHAGSRRARELQATRESLPIASFRSEVLDALAQHDVVLISGETGCGKSTQVPQFVLEDMVRARGAGARCQIVCTQPRRLAAMSLAERVSAELGEPAMGERESLCGFQIRLEQRQTRHTRLLFCTTGVLLRRLQDPATLSEHVSHVIVDEVHERDVQSDVLLSMLRAFIEKQQSQPHNHRKKRRLKVVLMSATLQAERFQQYFGGAARCPMLSVPGRTFPVQEFFLEDVLERTAFVLDDESPCRLRDDSDQSSNKASTTITISGRGGTSYTQRVTWDADDRSRRQRVTTATSALNDSDSYSARTWETLARLDERVINLELLELLLEQLVATDARAWLVSDENARASRPKSASILVFLPGLNEITTLLDALAANRVLRDAGDALDAQIECLPLHSSLSPEDQRRVFDLAPARGFSRKLRIIAATNVAETSLTIEDVKAVVDSGRAKEMRHDARARTNVLEEVWVSRANAKQRLGRAGRTSGGVCYRLFSRETARVAMAEQPVPELLRAPLTSLCLQIKAWGVGGSCAAFLDGCLDAPPHSSVVDAIAELHAIGAFKRLEAEQQATTNGEEQGEEEQETLTPLGAQLARLPVDVRVGKLLLLGAIWGVLDVVAPCAAVLETKSPFVAPFGRQRDMQAARERFVVGASDVLTDAHAFLRWRRVVAVAPRDESAFCRDHFLSRRALHEIRKLAAHLRSLVVSQLGFRYHDNAKKDDCVELTPATLALSSALLAAAMAPNVMAVDASASSPSRLALRDAQRELAFVHPSSVNAATRARAAQLSATRAVSPCYAFAVKLHTSQVFVPTSSLVLPTALCLFGAALDVVLPRQRALGDVTLLVDEWLPLRARSLRSAVVLQELRGVVQRVTQRELERFARKEFKDAEEEDDEEEAKLPPRETLVALVTELLLSELELRDRHRVLTKQLSFK